MYDLTPECRLRLHWFEQRVEELFPWRSCIRCAADNPEDATTHVDHFFDYVREHAGIFPPVKL